MNLAHVPVEVLNIISEYIELKDIGNFLATCSSMYDESDTIWRIIYMREMHCKLKSLEQSSDIHAINKWKKQFNKSNNYPTGIKLARYLKHQAYSYHKAQIAKQIQNILKRDNSFTRFNEVFHRIDFVVNTFLH